MKNCLRRSIHVSLLLLLVAWALASCAQVDRDPFTVILLPDTQNYCEEYPETYLAQTKWIAENAVAENTRFVIHLGDMVQHFDAVPEWETADRAHRVLDTAVPPVPYSVVPGNHDLVHYGDTTTWETDLFERYFGPRRFQGRAWYGGGMNGTNASNYCFFEGGGTKFMVLSLIFAPGEEVVTWAESVIEQFPDMPIILVTHAHLNLKGRLNHPMPYGLDGYAGDRLWENFVRKHENINLILCGHVSGANRVEGINDQGRPVHEILFDYQGEANGGNGWMVKMRFVPRENRIDFTTFSPVLGRIWDSPRNTFSLTYEFPGD